MAYASLADFKEYAGNSTITDDSLITDLLTRAQMGIDNYLHRTFEATTDTTKYFDADRDTNGLSLDWTPYGLDLCAITSVVNGNGTTITSAQYVTEPRHSTPYYGVKLKVSSGLFWEYSAGDDPENAIAITGRWAYSTTAPYDIRHATVRLAVYLYRQKDSGVFDVVMLPGSGEMIVPQGMPADVKTTLTPYRRLV